MKMVLQNSTLGENLVTGTEGESTVAPQCILSANEDTVPLFNSSAVAAALFPRR